MLNNFFSIISFNMNRVNLSYSSNGNYKSKNITCYELLKEETRRFCTDTSVHGFGFITLKYTTVTERFVWTFISFAAIIAAITLCILSWQYSTTYLTTTVTDSMEHPISRFLYPAVSICNLNKVSKTKALIFANEILKVENATEWHTKLHLLAQMYFANYEINDSQDYEEIQKLLDNKGITAEKALLEVTPSCKSLLQSCVWKGKQFRCDGLFEELRTVEGICCTFNHYAMKNRIFAGYMPERHKSQPRRLAACGKKSGMNVIINNDPPDYLISELYAYGTKVLIHNTYTNPDWSTQKILIPMLSQIYVEINPSKTYATSNVRQLSIGKRNCVFKNERTLQLYNNYTYDNCLMECRIEIIRKLCGCMPFYLKSDWATWYPQLRVCNLRDIPCLSANKHRYMSSVPGYDVYQVTDIDHVWGTEKSECECIPDCEMLTYVIHNTRGTLSTRPILNNAKFYGNAIKNQSVVSIFFKDLTAAKMKRDITITWTELFSLFGGILSLCLGFTFIAIFDVIYTYTIRLGIDVMLKKKSQSKIGNNLMTVEPKKDYNYFKAPPIFYLNPTTNTNMNNNIGFIN